MKKILFVVLCIIMILSVTSVFAFDNPINVVIDGIPMEFSDFYGYPVEYKDRVMLPFRQIFETYGWDAYYEEETETIMGSKDGSFIVMQKGSLNYFTEKGKVEFDVEPIIVNDRTMVPVRVISKILGFNVDWDEATTSVIISTK